MRIREIMEAKAGACSEILFSDKVVSSAVGVAESTFRTWKTGKAKPHPRHLKRLAAVLGVSVEDLEL